MINMPITDIMTLITGEVEKPAAPVADDGTADASFFSFFAGDDAGFERLSDGPNMGADSSVGAEENGVDIPVAKVMLLSGMMDLQVVNMPTDGSLKQRGALPVLYVSPEKMGESIQPDLQVGLPQKTLVGAPALQDTGVTQDVPRQTREAASVLLQMIASDRQVNAAIPAAISNDAPKQVRQPDTLAIPQTGGDVFQQSVMPEIAARPRPQIPVPTDPDVVSSPPENITMQMAPERTQKVLLGAPMVDEITTGKDLRQIPIEATEIKEIHRGQPLPIPQASKGVEISNAIVPPKVPPIATPANQQPAAVPSANAGLEPHVPQITPMSIRAQLAPSLPNADLPVSISRTTAELPSPHPVNAAKDSAADSAQLQKAQNPLPQHRPNRPAPDTPTRSDPSQPQATTAAPLQVNRSILSSVANPFAPLQPTVPASQSPKRQTSEGQLPQPDVQPAKQPTADTLVQTTTPAPLTPMADPAVTEGTRSELTPELIPLETRAADSATIARHDTITHRPEVGRHIAQQLAEAARQMPDRPVELTLNPDELGRVRLTFTMSDGGIHVAVLTERGETMDLLRRHIETLAQEFRDMGYKDVNFDFSRNSQGDSDNTDSNPDDPDDQTQTPTDTQTPAPVQLSLEPSTGLDLRL